MEPSTNEDGTASEVGFVETPEPSIITPSFSIQENIGEIIKWAKKKHEEFISDFDGKEISDNELESLEIDRKGFRKILTTLDTMRTEELRSAKEEIGRVEEKVREAKSFFQKNIDFIDVFLDKKERERIAVFKKEMVDSTKEMAVDVGLEEKYFEGIAFPETFLKKKNHTKKALEEAKTSIIHDLMIVQRTEKERVEFAKSMCESRSKALGLVTPITLEELGIVVEKTETRLVSLKIEEVAEKKCLEQERVKKVFVEQKIEKENDVEQVSSIIESVKTTLDVDCLSLPPEPDMEQRRSFSAIIEYSGNQRDWLNSVFALAKIKVTKI